MAEAKSDIAGSVLPMTKQQAVLMLESAYLWMDMGKYDNARELLSGAAALMPRSEVPQLAIGTMEFNQAKYDKALQAFRGAQRLAPRSALPRAHCGEALIQLNKGAEALKELVAGAEAEPGSDGAKFAVTLMVFLGNREFSAGRFDKAQQALQAAVKHGPDFALGHAYLGQVLYALGKDEEAKASLKKAKALEPSGDGARVADLTLDLMAKGQPVGPAKKLAKK